LKLETVNHHIQNAPKSLKQVRRMNDWLMIERVVKAVKKKLFRRGVNISITVSDVNDTTVARARARARASARASARARTLARQRGSKACKSRHRRVRAWNNDSTEDQTADPTDLAEDSNDPEMEAI
jgi:hypothetical protein